MRLLGFTDSSRCPLALRWMAWALFGVLNLALDAHLRADEAWRTDGHRLQGALELDAGQLRFKPSEGKSLALADIQRFRFDAQAAVSFRVGDARRVILRDGQRLTAQILGLSKEMLSLRTGWSARLEVPREAVAAIDPLPGWRTVLNEDFHDLKRFSVAGEPPLESAEERSVLLREVGQQLTCQLAQPLAAGRVGVNFIERNATSGAHWDLELLFRHGERERRITVAVAGEGKDYVVDADPLKSTTRKVARSPGWHRLRVAFRDRSLRITCDNDVLWYNLEDGPEGALRQVTIRCRRSHQGEPIRGAVAWSAFSVEHAVIEYPHPPGDKEQDEVRLHSDDQWFGRIVQADRRELQLEAGFGKRALPWMDVSGCSFRRRDSVAIPTDKKANVRLRLHSGVDAERDVLEGVVIGLDERKLVLRHALWGDIILARGWVSELQPLPDRAK